MIADLNSMPRIYWYCRKKFFNNELPDPNFDIIHSFKVMARFNYRKTKKKDKKKGRKWKTRIAQELNEKYGLHITKMVDGSKIPLSPLAPKI